MKRDVGMKQFLRAVTVFATITCLVQPSFPAFTPLVATQPDPQADVQPYFVADSDPHWTNVKLVR